MNKKGYEFVEAAVVLPVLIVTVIGIMAASLFLLEAGILVSEKEKDCAKAVQRSKKLIGIEKRKFGMSSDASVMPVKLRKSGRVRAYSIDQARAVRIGKLVK